MVESDECKFQAINLISLQNAVEGVSGSRYWFSSSQLLISIIPNVLTEEEQREDLQIQVKLGSDLENKNVELVLIRLTIFIA